MSLANKIKCETTTGGPDPAQLFILIHHVSMLDTYHLRHRVS